MRFDERFWSRVLVTRRCECWFWTGAKLKGYGLYRKDNHLNRAHRYAFEQVYGPIGDGLHCLHECDNPSCVNPSHLFLGTHQDNMADMQQKRRVVTHHGESHTCHKLTAQQVADIRRLYATGQYTQTQLARKYRVAQSRISLIVLGRAWTKTC